MSEEKMVEENKVEDVETRNEESSGGGWLVWIGLLLLINFLSYVFDWPFWIY